MPLSLYSRNPPLLNTRSLINNIVDDNVPDCQVLRDNWMAYARNCIAPALAYAREQQHPERGRLTKPLRLYKAVSSFFNPLNCRKYVTVIIITVF